MNDVFLTMQVTAPQFVYQTQTSIASINFCLMLIVGFAAELNCDLFQLLCSLRRALPSILLMDFCLQERDKSHKGKITVDQLEDIFRIYQAGPDFACMIMTSDQVELDEKLITKFTSGNSSYVTKEDFIKLATENKLLGTDYSNIEMHSRKFFFKAISSCTIFRYERCPRFWECYGR